MTVLLATIIGIFLGYALSWLISCGIIKLICLCFGLTFSWPIATGIWLIMVLIRGLLSIAIKR